MSREISVVKKPANNGNRPHSPDSDSGSSSVSTDSVSSVEESLATQDESDNTTRLLILGTNESQSYKAKETGITGCDVTNNVGSVPQEYKDETDLNDNLTTITDPDTSATLTTTNTESFEVVPNKQSGIAIERPVLPETSRDTVNSIASDEGNVQPSADSMKTMVGKEPSGKDVEESRGVLVVWVNPQSSLNSVYTKDTTTTLPRLDEPLGKGGNGQVVKCYVDTVVNNDTEVAAFACKIEKKKPLLRNLKMFEMMCQLTDEKYFVVIHAYLKEERPESPYGYVGYLIMEYFPLGNVSSVLEEFIKLDKCIKKIDEQMMQSLNDEDFGRHRISWQQATKKKFKVDKWCMHLFHGIINSLKALHNEQLVHLDIKDYNILLRKTCKHKNEFLCECDIPPFDVIIGDYDYCHEVGAPILHPKNVGTRKFQTFSLFADTKETLKSLASKSHATLGCEQLKGGLTSLDSQFEDVISEVSKKWWEQTKSNFVRFLKDTFSDTDDQLLNYRLWMFNEVLLDYEATFVEESTTQQDL